MFSEDYGFVQPSIIQINSISDTLRKRVWNLFYFNEIKAGGLGSARINNAVNGVPSIEDKIADRIGLLIDIPRLELIDTTSDRLRDYVISDCEWYKVYDFIEIHIGFTQKKQLIIDSYNAMLEQEKSGYRIVDEKIAPITNHEEVNSVQTALHTQFDAVNTHFKKALDLYSDRENPDYENCIKESISAIESLCCIITGLSGKNAILSNALKKLKEQGIYIHTAMLNAFNSLYGYTCDESGIRHGGIDFKSAPAEDAKYMLVSCSAFANYLIEKLSKTKS